MTKVVKFPTRERALPQGWQQDDWQQIIAACSGAVAAEEASFRYSIDVVSTGRELQNKEIHNIAGLGIANGDRPFRPFAKPMMFEPRSSIRIQITEISGPPGTLFIVLQGYKMLGTGRIPG